ncbi:MAG: sulfatase-like hydrolase/transferase [Nocardioides sp.]|nr:sulfatase-like hydrolase/transferase [Nocardioides sp.]
MTRPRPRRRGLAAAALLGAAALAASATPGAGAAPLGEAVSAASRVTAQDPDAPDGASHRNVLFLTVDDAAIGDLDAMPLARSVLGEAGTSYTQAVAPTPICVPARASMITGQHADNHGAHTISGPQGGAAAFEDDDTLPVALEEAGYETLMVGKYLNGWGADGDLDPPPGWTHWRGTVDPSTYSFFTPTLSVDGRPRSFFRYNSDLFSDLLEDFLRDPGREGRPWFGWVNFVAPHTGSPNVRTEPPNRFAHCLVDRPVRVPVPAPRHEGSASFTPLPDTPDLFAESEPGAPSLDGPTWTLCGREMVQRAHQLRLESLRAVDEAVDRAVATLEEIGQLDDTLVLLVSDNGFVTGQHNRYGKLVPYDQILRVPVLVRGPGFDAGSREGASITMADLATTIAAHAGVRPGRVQDGYPLTDLPRDRVVPLVAWPVRDGSRPLYRGVRTTRFTHALFTDGRELLFDRRVDPAELRNLVDDPAYADTLRAARTATETLAGCAGAECRVLDGTGLPAPD